MFFGATTTMAPPHLTMTWPLIKTHKAWCCTPHNIIHTHPNTIHTHLMLLHASPTARETRGRALQISAVLSETTPVFFPPPRTLYSTARTEAWFL